MTTNRELLELAAKAAGVRYCTARSKQVEGRKWWGLWLTFSDEPSEYTRRYWNPLTDDGDALRLAARLKLNIMQGEFSVGVGDEGEIDEASFVPDESQRLFAIREAIVRAAAEIGKAMP